MLLAVEPVIITGRFNYQDCAQNKQSAQVIFLVFQNLLDNMKTTKKLSQFIWDFNETILRQKQAFLSKDFVGLENVLKQFYMEGIIYGYKKHEKTNSVEIFLKVDYEGKIAVREIRNLSKPSMLIAGRIKELKADIRDRGHTSTIVRTAEFGLTTAKQAVKSKSGGIVLGKIV